PVRPPRRTELEGEFAARSHQPSPEGDLPPTRASRAPGDTAAHSCRRTPGDAAAHSRQTEHQGTLPPTRRTAGAEPGHLPPTRISRAPRQTAPLCGRTVLAPSPPAAHHQHTNERRARTTGGPALVSSASYSPSAASPASPPLAAATSTGGASGTSFGFGSPRKVNVALSVGDSGSPSQPSTSTMMICPGSTSPKRIFSDSWSSISRWIV